MSPFCIVSFSPFFFFLRKGGENKPLSCVYSEDTLIGFRPCNSNNLHKTAGVGTNMKNSFFVGTEMLGLGLFYIILCMSNTSCPCFLKGFSNARGKK